MHTHTNAHTWKLIKHHTITYIVTKLIIIMDGIGSQAILKIMSLSTLHIVISHK